MDREYFQHAVREATTSVMSITTRAIAFATSGMIAFYVFSSGPFIIISVASTLPANWVGTETGVSLSNENGSVVDVMLD
eukprot:CCRYP_000056-RA/>CCRYP_000056-RA protein AED:0.27 eAED:0.27 QI:0/-1/0/1/-1/1/1/0/78